MRSYIVRLSENEFGLYVSNYRNSFGTPLYFRGTLEEVLEARKKL
jgi:hypothetical protein